MAGTGRRGAAGPFDIARIVIHQALGKRPATRGAVVPQGAVKLWVPPGDDLAGLASLTLAEIADRPLALSDQEASFRHMLSLFRAIGVTPFVRHRATSIELLRSLAANGEGAGLSDPDPAGMASSDGKPVARVRIRDAAAVESIVLAYAGPQPAPFPGSGT